MMLVQDHLMAMWVENKAATHILAGPSLVSSGYRPGKGSVLPRSNSKPQEDVPDQPRGAPPLVQDTLVARGDTVALASSP